MILGSELSEIWKKILPAEEIALAEFLFGIMVKQLEGIAGVEWTQERM